MTSFTSSAVIFLLTFAQCNANSINATIWVVNVLVAATPISGPALVYNAPSVTWVMLLPTTFTIARVLQPYELTPRTAASVSAVSPDWVIAIVAMDPYMTGFV